MNSSRTVSTTKELKKAIDDKIDDIIITDAKLATCVKVASNIPYKTLAAIIGMAGASAVAFWNPVGWFGAAAGSAAGVGVVASAVAAAGITTGTAAIIGGVLVLLAALGISALAMVKDYDFEAGFSASSSGLEGGIPKGKTSAHLKIKRNV